MSDPNIRPNVDRVSGVPSCTETCPSHDGKRCRVLGLKAGGICEPAVIDIVVALRKTKATVEALDGAVNDALGALLDPDAKRRQAAIAEVSEAHEEPFDAARKS